MIGITAALIVPLALCIAALHPSSLQWQEFLIAPRVDGHGRLLLVQPSLTTTPAAHGVPNISGDAAVVLGYALHRNGSLTDALQARVVAGVHLYQQGSVPRLVFSGGHPGGGVRVRSEAAAMAAYARSLMPAPEGAWLLEEASTSTRENALYSLEMLRPLGACNIVVATNPFHQLRSWLTFRCAAKQLGMSCAQHPGGWYDALVLQGALVREVAALAWYFLRGWLC